MQVVLYIRLSMSCCHCQGCNGRPLLVVRHWFYSVRCLQCLESFNWFFNRRNVYSYGF